MTLKDTVRNFLASSGWVYSETAEGFLTQCCYHKDKTPSLSISVEKGLYHCFGCGASGRLGKFFVDNGLDVQDIPKITKKVTPKKSVVFPQSLLDKIYPQQQKAFDYLETRGISKETALLFNPRFREPNILALPIYDTQMRLISISRRTISGEKVRRKTRKTSPKSVLYGQHLMAVQIAKGETLFLVEGEIDVMSCVQAGVAAVGLVGDTLTQQQAACLSGAARCVVLLDADVSDRSNHKRHVLKIKQLVNKYSVTTVRTVSYNKAKDCNDILRLYGEDILKHYLDSLL